CRDRTVRRSCDTSATSRSFTDARIRRFLHRWLLFHKTAAFGNDRRKMRTSAACFCAGIEICRCRDRAMAQDAAHHFILARASVQEKLATCVPEEVDVEPKLRVFEHCHRNLMRERLR